MEFVSFRSAQIIFLFIVCEVGLLFSWGAERGTFYATHAICFRHAAYAGLAVATIQYAISNTLDVNTVERCTTER
jgi:hypothetical protein